MEYAVSQLAGIFEGKALIQDPQAVIATLLTDSRQVLHPENSLFFALQGKRNGTDFIPALYENGLRNFVVPEDFDPKDLAANFFVVPDVLTSLQQLSAFHRQRFSYPVVGITGSNGKTIVKEWLFQLISPDKKIVRNPKSFNSQTGVPLAVWAMDAQDELALFEAGISQPGEMQKLEKVIRPQIGILTHIGPAHDEGFANRNEKIAEKMTLFTGSEHLIYHADDLDGYAGHIPAQQHFSCGAGAECRLQILRKNQDEKGTQIDALFDGEPVSLSIFFRDDASVKNAITCWAFMLLLGYPQEIIRQRMERLAPVSMRLQLKTGRNNCSIIDDTYNSDVQSLAIALQFLTQQQQHARRELILSDILQTGTSDSELYAYVNELISRSGVNRLIGIGPHISSHASKFTVPAVFYPSTEAFITAFRPDLFRDATILIKGARPFAFERISRALEQKSHETQLNINLNALQHNLNFYRSKIRPGVKMMAMVKAFSYGSGSFEIANLLQFNRVDYLAVAYADEGVALRAAGIRLPILVLNPGDGNFGNLSTHNLEPEIYSFRLLDAFLHHAEERHLEHWPIHIKIDTGMKRLGFESADIPALLKKVYRNRHVRVASVFSHLVASGDPSHDDFTRLQIRRFTESAAQLEDGLGYRPLRHIDNTSAIHRFADAQMDMVRAGIGLYGVDAVFTPENSPLLPVATLRTSISQIKQVRAGETVGYNRNGKLAHDGQIATVKIGYADGYLRAFGKGVGSMIVNGRRAHTVGNISMDMCMLDITGIDAAEGDEVIVFGAENPINNLAAEIGTIPYEILTNISQRVKRVYDFE